MRVAHRNPVIFRPKTEKSGDKKNCLGGDPEPCKREATQEVVCNIDDNFSYVRCCNNKECMQRADTLARECCL